MLESVTWKSDSVFASFYLNDILYVFEGLWSLSPFVAGGCRALPLGSGILFSIVCLLCL